MRRLWIACAAACATAPSAPPKTAPRPAAVPRIASADPHSRDTARRRADEALRTDLPLDYERPFKPYVAPDRSATAALFAQACTDGDKGACIIEAELRPLDATGTAFHTVLANCMAGDNMSCRALPKDDQLPRFPNAPGAASRSVRCQHNLGSCDIEDLRRECREGFPAACDGLYSKLTDDVPEGHDAADRFVALNKDGCRHGVASECALLSGDPLFRDEMAQRSCELSPDTCSLAVPDDPRADKAVARDRWERACEFGENQWGVCIQLGEKYLAGELDEPVPGRGQQLLDWGCPKLMARTGPKLLDRHPACKSAKRP